MADGGKTVKRDIDLIRELMLKLEGMPLEYGDNIHLLPDDYRIRIDGYSFEQIAYHLSLIEQAEFIERGRSGPAIGIMFSGISWAGHDFIDSVRNQDAWDNTKSIAVAVGGFTVDILVTSAKAYLQQKFTELLGGQR